MIILGNVIEVVDENKLAITWYHRVPIGLEQGTRAYLVLLPRASGRSHHNMAEVIVSPINPHRWGDLWKIRCKFHERPGVVFGLLDLLAKKNINVLIQESVTTQQNRTHFVTIIADLADYEKDEDDSTFKRIHNNNLTSLETLKNEIAITLLEHMFFEGGEPTVTVTRMQILHEAYGAYHKLNTNSSAPNPITLNVGKNGVIVFDEPLLLKEIKSQLWGGNNEQSEQATIRQAILNTHTEDRYISIHFPDPNTNLVTLRIVHVERKGALVAIAKVMKDLDLNILNSFNRLQKMGAEAHWNVILDIGVKDSKVVAEQILNITNSKNQGLIQQIKERPVFEFKKEFRV